MRSLLRKLQKPQRATFTRPKRAAAFLVRRNIIIMGVMQLIRYFDMFAGIGGFRAGLTRAGGFQCVGHCEIDKYADRSYRAMHDIQKEECFYPDARTINPAEMPEFQLLCGGFPCQSYSIAGHKLGFNDERGTLFFEISRLARYRRPAYLLLENVPNLLSHDKGRTFAVILSALYELGYHVEWSVLNSKDFGVPQSRRRLFLVGYLDSRCAGKILPVFGSGSKALIQLIGGGQGYRVYDTSGVACTQTASGGGGGAKTGLYLVGYNRNDGVKGVRETALTLNACDYKGIERNQTGNAVFVDLTAGYPKQTELARCLTARYGETVLSLHRGERSGVMMVEDNEGAANEECPESGGIPDMIKRTGRIRRLMPRECLRLQGYSEEQIDSLLAVTSDCQAYKQSGNSVTVNVIEAIGRRIREVDEELKREDAEREQGEAA